jgi:alpha-tubulin suppressor-like RCC1 family protein
VAAGNGFTVALKADGKVWAWGDGGYGIFGKGSVYLSPSSIPVQNASITGVARIAVGSDHVLAIKNDGTLWAWGYNQYGQIGNGSSGTGSANYVTLSRQVAGMSGVIAVAGGTSHSLAVKSDGSVWAWGRNYYGQLGNGTTTDALSPVQVSGLSNVIAVAAGYQHSIALEADGTVWAWGAGSLGNGTSSQSNVPVLVPNLSGVSAIAAGQYHTVVITADGTLRVWGSSNMYGQLGDVTATQRSFSGNGARPYGNSKYQLRRWSYHCNKIRRDCLGLGGQFKATAGKQHRCRADDSHHDPQRHIGGGGRRGVSTFDSFEE